MNLYKYGMRCRPYSIGCQPMEGLKEATEDETGTYYNILVYTRPLTPEEITHYSLTDLQPGPDVKSLLETIFLALNKPLLKDLMQYVKDQSENTYTLPGLIKAYAATPAPGPDFIKYLEDLKTDNTITAQPEYYSIIDTMLLETI